MGTKKLFKPAVLAALIGSAFFASMSVQAAPTLTMLQAIEVAEEYTGKHAVSAEREGSKKRALWEINLVGNNGYETELRIRAKDGKIIREHEDYDRDDIVENKSMFKKIESGIYKSLSQAVAEAEKRWKGSHAVEASLDEDDDRDDDRYDRDDDRDDRDDDRDDRDDDRDDDRQGNKNRAVYEVELKKGNNDREYTINAKSKK